MKEKKVLLVLGGIVLGLFSAHLFLGLFFHVHTKGHAEIGSTDWFLTPHPIILGICVVTLLLIFCPKFAWPKMNNKSK